jgi:hypothetical protein
MLENVNQLLTHDQIEVGGNLCILLGTLIIITESFICLKKSRNFMLDTVFQKYECAKEKTCGISDTGRL